MSAMYRIPEKKRSDLDRLRWVVEHADSISVNFNWPTVDGHWWVFTKNGLESLGYSKDMCEAIDEAMQDLEDQARQRSIEQALFSVQYYDNQEDKDAEIAQIVEELGVQSEEVYLELERMMDTRIDCRTVAA